MALEGSKAGVLPLMDGEVHLGVVTFLTAWELAQVFEWSNTLFHHFLLWRS
jgi:hypothetical protein